MDDVRLDAIVQLGLVERVATTEMIGAAVNVMLLGLGGLAQARQLFDVEVFASVVWQQR
jgi:hypothetical protein